MMTKHDGLGTAAKWSTFVALAASALSSAAAVTPAPATFRTVVDIELDGNQGVYTAVNYYNLTGPDAFTRSASSPSGFGGFPLAGSGTAMAGNSIQPTPLMQASASGMSSFSPSAILHDYTQVSAMAQLDYQFAINGPTPTVAINAQWALFAAQSAAAAGDYSNSASGAQFLLWNSAEGNLILDTVSSYNQDQVQTESSSHNQVIVLNTNTIYNVQILANAVVSIRGNVGNLQGGGAEVNSAWADPSFSIAGSVPNAASYSLSFSAGIGNAAPVPEPAAWLLMALGLGSLLVRPRRP